MRGGRGGWLELFVGFVALWRCLEADWDLEAVIWRTLGLPLVSFGCQMRVNGSFKSDNQFQGNGYQMAGRVPEGVGEGNYDIL